MAVIQQNPATARTVADCLRAVGIDQFVQFDAGEELAANIRATDPELILAVLENPDRNVLQMIFKISEVVKRPLAIISDSSDCEMIQAAVDAGVSAYAIGEITTAQVRHVVELCAARFIALTRLQEELDRVKAALEERKVIDRAKGVLMSAKRLTEDQAYSLMRRTAMDKNKKIADIAQSIMAASALLK
jgi:two-component system, response regulator / RNA-binding antiterminator